MFEVFISHSSKDKLTADAVCAILEQRGIRCWIAPRDITPGVEWGEAILMGIEACSIMVLVFSANANASPQVRREVERAVNKGLIVVPLRIEDILPAKSMEYFLSNVHWLDALTPPMTAHIERLAEQVLAVLGREYQPEPVIEEEPAPQWEPEPAPEPTLPSQRTWQQPAPALSMWQRVLRLPRRHLLIGAAILGGAVWIANLSPGKKTDTHPQPASTPTPPPVASATPRPQRSTPAASLAATKDSPWTNTLGMKFVPSGTPGVLMSIWETRVQDYAKFAEDTKREVVQPSFEKEQGPTHPVVNVSYLDAVAFCEWLSKKEGKTYRLPTDAEWSTAVGLTGETGATPKDKHLKAPGYPWGPDSSPPKNFGNYASTLSVDTFQYTAPVGSFKANSLGIYDLFGNVWEWCDDWYDSEQKYRTARGGSWGYNGEGLRSSRRGFYAPDHRDDGGGFRCVVGVAGSGR